MINSSFSCRLLRSPSSHNYDFRRVGVSVSVCETVAIALPQLLEEIWGLNSQTSKEDTQVVYEVCPQLTTFPATRDSCRSDLDVFLCVTYRKRLHPLGNSCLSAVKPPQDHRTEQTLVLLQESSLHWIQFSPLSAPHLQRTTIFSGFGMRGNCFLYASPWTQILPKTNERQKRTLGPQLKTSASGY